MKNKEIIRCLKANKEISNYELNATSKESKELYYVLDHLEINRSVHVLNQIASIYVLNKDKIGSSSITITAADDEKSLFKKLKEGVQKAKSALNPYYPLPKINENIKNNDDEDYDLNAIGNNIAKAIFQANVYEDGWLNSTEIFINKIKRDFYNSNGVHHESTNFEIKIELIPTWKNEDGEEFELYKFYQSSKIDYKAITKEVNALLENAKLRSHAKKIQETQIDSDVKVLVQDEMLQRIVGCLREDSNYRTQYLHMNHYDLNAKVSDNKFNLSLLAEQEGCIASKKFDQNGIVLDSIDLISNGKLTHTWGDCRFGYYTKQDHITGSLPISILKAKSHDYTKEKHLIIENFSSPQLDVSIGYWGGEVRLAKYFDGEKYIPLTGFSISGNIYENLKDVEFSKEKITLSNYCGPKYFIFKNISIH